MELTEAAASHKRYAMHAMRPNARFTDCNGASKKTLFLS